MESFNLLATFSNCYAIIRKREKIILIIKKIYNWINGNKSTTDPNKSILVRIDWICVDIYWTQNSIHLFKVMCSQNILNPIVLNASLIDETNWFSFLSHCLFSFCSLSHIRSILSWICWFFSNLISYSYAIAHFNYYESARKCDVLSNRNWWISPLASCEHINYIH